MKHRILFNPFVDVTKFKRDTQKIIIVFNAISRPNMKLHRF